jgi:hypothetical protein
MRDHGETVCPRCGERPLDHTPADETTADVVTAPIEAIEAPGPTEAREASDAIARGPLEVVRVGQAFAVESNGVGDHIPGETHAPLRCPRSTRAWCATSRIAWMLPPPLATDHPAAPGCSDVSVVDGVVSRLPPWIRRSTRLRVRSTLRAADRLAPSRIGHAQALRLTADRPAVRHCLADAAR